MMLAKDRRSQIMIVCVNHKLDNKYRVEEPQLPCLLSHATTIWHFWLQLVFGQNNWVVQPLPGATSSRSTNCVMCQSNSSVSLCDDCR
jgi:hypothetical protein